MIFWYWCFYLHALRDSGSAIIRNCEGIYDGASKVQYGIAKHTISRNKTIVMMWHIPGDHRLAGPGESTFEPKQNQHCFECMSSTESALQLTTLYLEWSVRRDENSLKYVLKISPRGNHQTSPIPKE